MLKRRLFLSAIAAGASSAMMPAVAFAATRNLSLADQFADLIGSDFHFRDAEGASLRVRLDAFDKGADTPGVEQFSVVFSGEGLEEGLYDIHHPGTGQLTVYCMPSTEGRQRAYFSYLS